MMVDDELRGHVAESIIHLTFIRNFMWRTGYISEVNELGWAYGSDPNYGWGDELYYSQLSTILDQLAPDLHGDVTFMSMDDEMWATCQVIDGIHNRERIEFDMACVIKITGTDAHELEGWRRFIWWQECHPNQDAHLTAYVPDSLMFMNEDEESPHFLWVLPEASVDEIMNDWEKKLISREGTEFYTNVSNAW